MRFQPRRTGTVVTGALVAVTTAMGMTACAGQAPGGGHGSPSAASPSADHGRARLSYRLTGVSLPSSSRGYGVFVSRSSSRCRIAVGATSDAGARFGVPVPVATWRCASEAQPARSLAFDTRGDGFLYGPALFVTHDGGRTWTASRQPGEVLAVALVQRSAWMLQAACRPDARPGRCALRLLESANGGRSWAPAPSQPPAFAPEADGAVPAGAARGQSWLVRTGRDAGYVASLLMEPGKARRAGLWHTSNSGGSWSRRATPCTGWAAALAAAPGGTVFAVCGGEPGAGMQGKTVARSVDGGRSWERPVTCHIGACPGPIGSGYLGSIDAVDAGTVYLVGDRSSLLVGTDGGRRWHIVTAVTAGTDAGTSQVLFPNQSDGLVIGISNAPPYAEQVTMWRTDDGGAHWSVVRPVVG